MASQQKEKEEENPNLSHKVEIVIKAINDIYYNFFPNAPVVSLPQQLAHLLDLSRHLKDIRDNLHLLQSLQFPNHEHTDHPEQNSHDETQGTTEKLLIRMNDPNIIYLMDNWMRVLQEWVTSDVVHEQDLSLGEIVLMATVAHEELGKGIRKATKLMGVEVLGKVDHDETEGKSGDAKH